MNATSYRSKTNPLVLNTAPPTKIRNIFSSHAEALITPDIEIQPRLKTYRQVPINDAYVTS